MVSDANKQIMNISYTHQNLPRAITIGGDAEHRVCFLYDATGRKIRKQTLTNQAINATTDYVGSFVYENNALQYILTAEGRVVMDGPDARYQYFLKDHLGNTRVVFDNAGNITQDNSYYPFGMVMSGLDYDNESYAWSNKYLYNGKEFQDDFGLDWYDYGARFYDPVVSHFFTIDPLAEKFLWHSPYSYAANNPLRYIDYHGLGPNDRVKAARSMTGIKYKQESVSSLRTANTTEARQYMDCAEFVCRVLGADQITDGVQHMNSSSLKVFFDNKEQFIHSSDPQYGDIALWNGHVGVVTEVGEDGKIKLTHARGAGKLSNENPYAILPEQYRNAEFYGYFRPVNETPDGKIDNNGNPLSTNNQPSNHSGSFDLTTNPEPAIQDNTRVINNSFVRQLNKLLQGKYIVVNGQIVPQ